MDNDLIEQHLRELRRRNLAAGSVYKRGRVAVRFSEWMAPQSMLDATPSDVDDFLDGCSQRRSRPIGARTRYDWCSHLHMIFEWAIRHGHTDNDPTALVVRPKTDRLLPRPIADVDLAVALAAADTTMRAWLLLGALAGLRVSEIAGLNRSDIVEGDMLLRIFGKGRKERFVPLHPAVLAALRGCGLPKSGPVFVRDEQPYAPGRVSRVISEYFARVGVDATAHQLRHWFATKTYRGCRDIRTVQELLGHASPTTTAIYTAASRADAHAAVAALAAP